MTFEVLYQSDRALVVHGSALELCEELGPRSVDVVLTDPPYTPHVHGNIRSCNTTGKVKVKQWEPGFDPLTSFAHVPALVGTARRWILCCCALESFGDYMHAAGGHWKEGGSFVRSGIWRKKNAAPQLSGDRPANSCEGIAVMHARTAKGERMRWNGHGKHAFWRVDDEDVFFDHGRERGEKVHPTQKPQSLMREMVRLFTDPDDLVLDPYGGSGATALAVLSEGRQVVIGDADRKWAEHIASLIRDLESGEAA